MGSKPVIPEDRYAPSEEEERVIRERLETYEADKKNAVDAREALAEICRNLKAPNPH